MVTLILAETAPSPQQGLRVLKRAIASSLTRRRADLFPDIYITLEDVLVVDGMAPEPLEPVAHVRPCPRFGHEFKVFSIEEQL
jgi:hypothetical protein